ncbi:MAG: PilZ domain-containing protein [Candidatus Aureabacteria bacterium]|nr:PilZ domain-containing protein [Candidatus Auribacterota bacterium]
MMNDLTFPAEKRKYIRIPRENVMYVSLCDIHAEMNLKQENTKIEVRTKDISAGGILFESSKKFDIEDLLKIEIILPNWEKYKKTFFGSDISYPTKPFLILGKVIRIEFLRDNIYDIGINFVGVETSHQELLLNYLNDRANIEE